jgi:hypothetical protein
MEFTSEGAENAETKTNLRLPEKRELEHPDARGEDPIRRFQVRASDTHFQ